MLSLLFLQALREYDHPHCYIKCTNPTLQHEHTIAKLATRHLTMAVRGEHVLASYPDWPRYEANYMDTHVIGMHKLLLLLYWDNLRQCLMYTYLGLLISMPDSQKVMNESIQIVWFDEEGFSNCQNLSWSGEWGVGSCKWGELRSLESQCLWC